MKIISNYKDYYDYLTGIYGIDEKVVYDRTFKAENKNGQYSNWIPSSLFIPDHINFPDKIDLHRNVTKYTLHICGVQYTVFVYGGKYYFGYYGVKELYELSKTEKHNLTKDDIEMVKDYMYYCGYSFYRWEKDKNREKKINDKYHNIPSKVNDKLDCPVVLEQLRDDYVKNIRLSDFGINKLITAEDIYLRITNFLTREPVIVDKRTNKEKIVSNGFDIKTSFRNM